jgi:NitT/TauT family transport system permease protein
VALSNSGGIVSFLSIRSRVNGKKNLFLSLIPFVLFLSVYVVASHVRHEKNPEDKILPPPSNLVQGFKEVAFQPDRRGEYLLWEDTLASSRRFGISILLLLPAFFLGAYMGLFPILESIFYKTVAFLDKIPPMGVLPVLFVLLNVGEPLKLGLIILGVAPTLALDAFIRTKEIHKEQIVKGMTLAATDYEIAHRIVLPQIWPSLMNTLKLNYKAILFCLLAAESTGGQVGLGYRTFVLMRYTAMYKIIPYVVWMSLLVFLLYFVTSWLINKKYRWQTT